MNIRIEIDGCVFDCHATETIEIQQHPGWPVGQNFPVEKIERENDANNDRLLQAQKQFLDFVASRKTISHSAGKAG